MCLSKLVFLREQKGKTLFIISGKISLAVLNIFEARMRKFL